MNGRKTDSDGAAVVVPSSATIFLIVVFVSLTLIKWKSPGLIFDNLNNEASSAMGAEALHVGWRALFKNFSFDNPLYHGRLTAFLMLPFFYVLGRSLLLMKLWPIVFGVLTIVVTGVWVRAAFGARTALVATALLVFHPSFVFGIKAGQFHVSYMLFFSSAAVYFFYKSWTTKRKTFYWGAWVLLGLGMGTRLWFCYVVCGAILSSFLVTLFAERKALSPVSWAGLTPVWLALSGLAVGSLSVLVTEFQGNFPSLRLIYLIETATEHSSMIRRLPLGIHQLKAMLSGQYFFERYFGAGGFENGLYPWIFWTALIWNLGVFSRSILRKKIADPTSAPGGKLRGWLALLALAIVFQASLSARDHGHRIFVVYPLVQVLIALFVRDAWVICSQNKKWRSAALGLFAMVLGTDMVTLAGFEAYLVRFGAMNKFSDSIHELARWMEDRKTGNDALLLVPLYLANNLYLSYPELGIDPNKNSVELNFPAHRFFVFPPRGHHLGTLSDTMSAERYAGLMSAPRQLKELRMVAPPGKEDFREEWRRVLARKRANAVTFVGYPAADYLHTRHFFCLAASQANREGRRVRLLRQFQDGDGATTFSVYRLSGV